MPRDLPRFVTFVAVRQQPFTAMLSPVFVPPRQTAAETASVTASTPCSMASILPVSSMSPVNISGLHVSNTGGEHQVGAEISPADFFEP